MDIENRKISYIDDIEGIEEEPGNSEYPSNIFQDPYFSFMKLDIDGENIRNKNLRDNYYLNETNNLNEDNNINEDNNNNFNEEKNLNENNILNAII